MKNLTGTWRQYAGPNALYLLRNTSYLAASEVVVTVLRLALSVALIRLLGGESYGKYGYVISWLTVASVTTLPGLDTAVNAAAARGYDGTLVEAVRTKGRCSLLGSMVLLGVAGWRWLAGDYQVALSLVVGALFLNGYFLTIYDHYLQGKQAFVRVFSRRLVLNLTVVVATGVVAGMSRNLVATTAAFLGTTALVNWYFTYRSVQEANGAGVEDQAVAFGKSITWVSLIAIISSNLDRLMIQGHLGYQELAIYMVATALPSQMRRAYGIIFSLVFPKVAQGTLQDALAMLRRRWLIIVGALVTSIGGVALVIPWLIPLVYGSEYRAAVWYAELYLLVPLLVTLYSIFTKVLLPAHRRGSEIIKLSVCEAASDFVGFSLLIPSLGLLGAILAQIATAVVVNVYVLLLLRQMLAVPANLEA